MIQFLKEVGRGKRGARDLSYEEAVQAAELILSGAATPAQIGAFLMAERIKTESMEEILAFTEICRSRINAHDMEGSLDCAGPYDGRRTSFLATFPAAFVLTACGLPVTLHSSPSLPPKWGITLADVMQELGIRNGAQSRETLIAASKTSGLLYVPTEEWCPDLGRLRPFRIEIGVRSLYNTVEKLLRFSNSPYMAVGVYHGTVFEKVAQLLIQLGIKNGIVVQGMEGSEDVSVSKRTRALLIRNGEFEPFLIDPEQYGLQAELPELEWTPELHLQTALAVLKGEADEPFRNLVLLNSAIRLLITGRAASIEQGIAQAEHALDSGLAWKRYENWREAALAAAAH